MAGVDILATAMTGANAAYLADLYARWTENPGSVDPTFAELFASLNDEARAVLTDASGASWAPRIRGAFGPDPEKPAPAKGAKPGAADPEATRRAVLDSIRALMLIRSYRVRGHLEARLDPLGLQVPKPHPELDPKTYGFSDEDWDRQIFLDFVLGKETASLREILAICREAEIFVVEDNPYGLLGFDKPSPNAMRAEDSENVIYLGSFSKTIASGLRIGWALVPQSLKDKLVIASESSILCPSNFTQLTISSYLADQPWRDQIASFCELYKVRRDAMLESLEQHFPAEATWTKPGGGFYVWVNLPAEIDTKALMPKAIVAKVAYVPGNAFYADGLGSWAMRLSYCHPTPERIREGVKALGGVIKQEMQRRGTAIN